MNRGLTAKGAATRQRIVEAAALLIRENGAGETSIDTVLETTSTSKSQLFHYFPNGRADLLRAVTEHEAMQVLEAQQPFLSDLSNWSVWQEWQRAVMSHYVELGARCPLGALTSELGKSSPETRLIVNELYDTWEAALAAGVEKVIPGNPGDARESHAKIARQILTSIQGGVVMLKATGRVTYLETALECALEPLRPTRVTAA